MLFARCSSFISKNLGLLLFLIIGVNLKIAFWARCTMCNHSKQYNSNIFCFSSAVILLMAFARILYHRGILKIEIKKGNFSEV